MEKWRICKKKWEKLNYSESTSKQTSIQFKSIALYLRKRYGLVFLRAKKDQRLMFVLNFQHRII